ncbi:hypothetical protein Glove_267g54 [Diversispora epigaea]|uniref:HTH merR-type domain-containing protein n=1 Tax=Diversispora epigaea TaxID=1348612 RepID=A0A397ID86_9GLOM|nr:hypothetical protein Glove_267g54 [Diversispora epigaea]
MFGFTEEEVKFLISKNNHNFELNTLRSYYNGYQTSTDDDSLQRHVEVELIPHLRFDFFKNEPEINAIYTLLCYSNYLTVNFDDKFNNKIDPTKVKLVIPNREITKQWKKWIIDFIGISRLKTNDIFDSLFKKDIKFCEQFPILYAEIISCYDISDSIIAKSYEVRTKSKRRMTSQLKHCDDGPTPEELLLSGHLVENDSIQLLTYKKSLEITNRHKSRKRPRSVTPESVQNINETTLNEKTQTFDNTTQNTKSSVISDRDLTGNAGGLLPFWNEYTQKESKKWWLSESAHKIQETYDVSVETLRRWADSGRIAIVRTPGEKRLYSITDIQEIFRDNQQTQITQKAKICYARVKGIEEVVVIRKDRLCRFGSELVEWIFEKNGTQLVVLGTDVSAESKEVKFLISKNNHNFELNTLRSYYNGYQTSTGVCIYNPRSVISFLNEGIVGDYWANGGLGFMISEYDDSLQRHVEVELIPHLRFDFFKNEPEINAIYTLLCYSNYLTVNFDDKFNNKIDPTKVKLVIPNREITKQWKKWIIDFIGISRLKTNDIFDSLFKKDIKFCEQFPILYAEIISCYDISDSIIAKSYEETYDVSVETLRRWADSGRIAIVRTPGEKRLYSITDIQEIFRDNQQTQITQKAKICYARVKGIEEVVVIRKDRLCRFGSELVEWIFEKNGTQLVVLGTDVSAESSEAGVTCLSVKT